MADPVSDFCRACSGTGRRLSDDIRDPWTCKACGGTGALRDVADGLTRAGLHYYATQVRGAARELARLRKIEAWVTQVGAPPLNLPGVDE